MNTSNEKDDCPVCPKKITYTEENFSQDFEKYLKIISDKDKAPDDIYNERLKKCLSCQNMENGLCNHCGCFIQFRCILKRNHCPAPKPLW